MVIVTTLCTDCAQIITNPICPHCFLKQVLAWLRDKNMPFYHMNKIKELIRELKMETEEIPSEIRCILCGCERVNLCSYCVTQRTHKIVYPHTNIKTQEEFKEDFNTKIWRIQ